MGTFEIDLSAIESWEYIELPEVYDITVQDEHCYYIDAGGKILVHNSGKTYSVIQLLIIIAAIKQPGVRISIVSHSLPHIKRGAYRDFKSIMESFHLWSDAEFSYSDYVYHFSNGSYIELFGLEDEGKARGPGRDILFVNEANLIHKTLYDQLSMRTTGTIFINSRRIDSAVLIDLPLPLAYWKTVNLLRLMI